MKKLITFLMIAGLVFAIGCSKDALVNPDKDLVNITPSLKSLNEIPFLAGQTYPAGAIDVTNDAVNLYVTVTLFADQNYPNWFINESHLFVGWGEPKKHSPGKFPFKIDDQLISTHLYEIPLASFDPVPEAGDQLWLAVHGDILETDTLHNGTIITLYNESAWALPSGYLPFKQGWGGYFSYVLDAVSDPEFVVSDFITPNGDGINDFTYILGIEDYPQNEFRIFNRWGTLIASFVGYNNSSVVWYGLTNWNDPVPAGQYFYNLTVEGISNEYAGIIMVIW